MIELVSASENKFGQVTITIQRGKEVKELVVNNFWDDLYERAIEYYMDEKHWTQEKFDEFWDDEDNQDAEFDDFVGMIVDICDDDETWEGLGTPNSFNNAA